MASSTPVRIPAIIFLTFALISCSKRIAEVDNESQSIIDNSICMAEYSDLARTAFDHVESFVNGKGPLTIVSGDSLWTSTSHQPLTLSMSASTYSADKVHRSGTVTIRITAHPLTPGNTVSLRMNGYHARGLHFGCDSILVTCKSYSPGRAELKAEVVNGQLYVGHDDPPARFSMSGAVNDDGAFPGMINIQGSTQGTSRQGLAYSSEAPGPLFKRRSCRSISGGVLHHHPKGLKSREVYYSTDSSNPCDNDILFAVNGNTVTVKTE